jgi:hypothetical protein
MTSSISLYLPILAACCLLLGGMQASASRYTNGLEGIKAASVPGEGLYYRTYNLGYSADSLNDSNGNSVDGDFDLTVFASAHRLIWVTPYEFLGGELFVDFVVPVLSVELDAFGVNDTETGLGDIYIEPIGLAWHGETWDLATALGVFLDNADFDADAPVNLGAGYVSYMATLGGTKYFGAGNKTSVSILARYETHDEQDDTGVTVGDDFHFEYGIGYAITPTVEVGIAGYVDMQVDENDGIDNPADKTSVYALGIEAAAVFPKNKWLASFRLLDEFEAETQQEGIFANLTLTKIF